MRKKEILRLLILIGFISVIGCNDKDNFFEDINQGGDSVIIIPPVNGGIIDTPVTPPVVTPPPVVDPPVVVPPPVVDPPVVVPPPVVDPPVVIPPPVVDPPVVVPPPVIPPPVITPPPVTVPSAKKQEVKTVSITNSVARTSIQQYLAYTPKGYDANDKTKKWPLVIFLHGSGERGTDINRVKTNGFPKLCMNNDTDYQFVMISPQLTPNIDWNTWHLQAFFQEVVSLYNIDPSRIILTGLSLGGGGTWLWANDNPQNFAAIVPVCGWGAPSQACKLKNVAVWAFHGDKDTTVPTSSSVAMIDALKACGANPTLTLYPGVGHDSWSRTYSNPEVVNWIMKQKK
jgi:predicted esterase